MDKYLAAKIFIYRYLADLIFGVRNVVSTTGDQVVVLIDCHAGTSASVGVRVGAALGFEFSVSKHGKLSFGKRHLLRRAV